MQNHGNRSVKPVHLAAVALTSLVAFVGAASSGAAPISTSAAAPGLVAAYSFDAGSGTTVADDSGNNRIGTISGATWGTGKTGTALAFDGVNDWVTVADAASLDLTNRMTLEAWVKPSAQGVRWRTVVIKERNGGLSYALYSNTDTGRPSSEMKTSKTSETRGTAALPTSTWSHLATTYDGATLRLFVNGVQAASKRGRRHDGHLVGSSPHRRQRRLVRVVHRPDR